MLKECRLTLDCWCQCTVGLWASSKPWAWVDCIGWLQKQDRIWSPTLALWDNQAAWGPYDLLVDQFSNHTRQCCHQRKDAYALAQLPALELDCECAMLQALHTYIILDKTTWACHWHPRSLAHQLQAAPKSVQHPYAIDFVTNHLYVTGKWPVTSQVQTWWLHVDCALNLQASAREIH